MSYSAGRLSIYVDMTTAKADYTNETFDSMTQPVVNQICDIFGMHIITDLTEETTRGHRYYIGFEDNDPKLAIGWAIGNTYSNAYYLMCVGMFDGAYLYDIFSVVSSSAISDNQYYIRLIEKNFSNTNKYFYINYISDDNLKAISGFYSQSTIGSTTNMELRFALFKVGSKKLMSYWYSNQYYTYDYSNDGLNYIICKSNIYFINCKNNIANNDFEYIAELKLEHNETINGLYIYSRMLTVRKIYNINGEYYFCLASNSNDGSFLMKVSYSP